MQAERAEGACAEEEGTEKEMQAERAEGGKRKGRMEGKGKGGWREGALDFSHCYVEKSAPLADTLSVR